MMKSLLSNDQCEVSISKTPFMDDTVHTMRMFLENMVSEALFAKKLGIEVPVSQIVCASFDQILKIAEQIPLARQMDEKQHSKLNLPTRSGTK